MRHPLLRKKETCASWPRPDRSETKTRPSSSSEQAASIVRAVLYWLTETITACNSSRFAEGTRENEKEKKNRPPNLFFFQVPDGGILKPSKYVFFFKGHFFKFVQKSHHVLICFSLDRRKECRSFSLFLSRTLGVALCGYVCAFFMSALPRYQVQ